MSNGHGEKYKGHNAILVTDVITTARSSLEAHTRATLRGIPVLCWATLIDRTFGPGPVPVVSAFTGAPVRVLTQVG
jgi:orotate phosphoribosyltransferase